MSVSVVTDGTAEGLLTVVYKYYYEKLRPLDVIDGSSPAFQQAFGVDYLFVETDREMAEKVYGAMEKKLRAETLQNFQRANLSGTGDKHFDLFRYVLLAFKEPDRVDSMARMDFVMSVQKLAQNVGREAHKLTGFLRFRQTSQGILYADVSPKNNVLAILCAHFMDRLGGEAFVIHDLDRGLAGVYHGEECVIVEIPKDLKPIFDDDGQEGIWQELWAIFYNTIGIQERKNSRLRTQLNPKYFWKHQTEHQIEYKKALRPRPARAKEIGREIRPAEAINEIKQIED